MTFLDTSYASSAGWGNLTPQIALLCWLGFSSVSRAQMTTSTTAANTPSSPISAVTSMPDFSSTTRLPISANTTLSTSSRITDTITPDDSDPTEAPGSDIFDQPTDSDGHPITGNTVFNYYFLFLVLFGVIVAALLWWLRRERKRRKERMRQSGQHALARDLEGWPAARRFMHGRYGRHFVPARVRREEGLDEHGEAPPPYQPKSDISVSMTPAGGSHEASEAEIISVPLRTLSLNNVEHARPPAYSNAQSNVREPPIVPNR